MKVTQCLNCSAEMTGQYCSNCGQKRQERITWKGVGSSIYDALFDFESPFLKSFVQLTINPGKVYRDYLEGARKRYFSPIRYSFWIVTLLVAVAALRDASLIEFPQTRSGAMSGNAGFLRFQDFINAAILPIYVISALCMAAMTRLFFKKHKYTAVELFIPFLLNFCQFSLATTLVVLFGGDLTTHWPWLAVLSIFYMVWGLAVLYQFKGKGELALCFVLALIGPFVSGMITIAVPALVFGYLVSKGML